MSRKWQQLSLSVPAPISRWKIWVTSNVTKYYYWHTHLIEVNVPLQYHVASPVTCFLTLRENVIVSKRRKIFTQWPASHPRQRNSQPYFPENFEALNLLNYLVFNAMEYSTITNDKTISRFFNCFSVCFQQSFSKLHYLQGCRCCDCLSEISVEENAYNIE
jgi:uncharacterized protein (DUF486 family)